MTVKDISMLVKNLGGVIAKNSPQILTGLAATGVISVPILAVTATIKALPLLDEERRVVIIHEDRELTTKDIVRVAWKCYLPTAGMCIGTLACVIGAHKVSQRRTAAIVGLYSLTEVAFKEYKEKVAETIGRVKEQRVRDEVDADRIKKNPSSTNEVIFTGKGEVLCYDTFTGRYFKSDIEKIRRVRNDLNHRLMTEMFIELNEFYYELGLTNVVAGDMLGFDLDNGKIEINFSSQLSDIGEPCLVLNYEVVPKYK
jgi:hypothetical protein